MHKRKSIIKISIVSILAVLMSVSLVSSAVKVDTSDLRQAVTVEGVRSHQAEFQAIADANDGTRVAGSPGDFESQEYVADLMLAAGYDVTIQTFDFQSWRPSGPSTLEQTAPGTETYVEDTDYNLMSQTDAGNVESPVTGVDLALADPSTSTSGCETGDFSGFPVGDIALIQRGACTFQLKAENAADAGAIGAIIFNQGNPDLLKFFNNSCLTRISKYNTLC